MKKKYFDNLPLKSKLAVSIILCIILPIFIIAATVGRNLFNENKNSAYQNQLSLMQKSMEDIDLLYTHIWNLKNSLLVNFEIMQIARGNADAEDYYKSVNKINDLMQNSDSIHSLSISTEERIVFQQDKYLLYEKPEFLKRALTSGPAGFWTEMYVQDNAFFDKEKVLLVQSFFTLMNKAESEAKLASVLAVSIKEESLSKLLIDQFESSGAHNFLIREDGLVLSSNDKKQINTLKAELLPLMANSSGVIERNNNTVLFYMKGHREDVILVSSIPDKVFNTGQNAFYFTIILAIILSLLFGVVFSLIQSRYIIQPLNRLLEDMENVKAGQFNIYNLNHNRDEIGHISIRFDEMKLRLKQTIDEVYISRIHEQEAQFTALVSQINPHFLYNTLDSIRWMAYKNKDIIVGEQIEALSDVFRHVLSEGRSYVDLNDELAFIRDYMFLMKARYGERISLEIDMDETLGVCQIPKLIIQPLIENSIQHGLESKIDGGKIWIKISASEGHIQINVEDNGVGAVEKDILEMMESRKSKPGAFALKNINDRLVLCYGDDYALRINSKVGKGFKVLIRIPMDKDGLNETHGH